MINLDPQIFAFTLVALALTLAPGADTLLVLRNVLRGGCRSGLVTTVGICSGLYIHALFSALGLSMLLAQSAQAFALVKTAGALYLLWLGFQSLRTGLRARGPVAIDAQSQRCISLKRSFLEGFLSNVLNPKAVVFYLTILPQFIRPGDAVVARSILLASIHFTMGTLWLCGLSLFISRSRSLILRPLVRRAMDALCGAMLMALGIRLALSRS